MCISSFVSILSTIIAIPYISTAEINDIIVANLIAINPNNIEYIKYEQIPIIMVAIIGFTINLYIFKSNAILFLRTVNPIEKEIIWHTTEPIAAPFSPILGIGTKIKFNINLAITPTS